MITVTNIRNVDHAAYNEATCHRSIVAGILQHVGTQVQGVKGNYHQYGRAYMHI